MRIDYPLETTMGRRTWLRSVFILGAGLLAGIHPIPTARAAQRAKVVIVKTDNRIKGIKRAMAAFDLSEFKGTDVAIKANFNSADPFPASTHPEALLTMGRELLNAGANSLTMAERSGMGDTERVLRRMGVNSVADLLDMRVVVMDDLGADDYVHHQPKGSHWKRGFLLARTFAEADKVVQTCCLKTHQYGGHFTMALKNAVGAVAKYDPVGGYNYMSELHNSPLQRSLTAEISLAFRNDFIVMDAMKAFVTGGPHKGKEVAPGVIVAGTDPVAIDAVGVAILRMFGTTPEVSEGKIFDQEQIRRAAELGVGVRRADAIKLIGIGDGSAAFVREVQAELG